MACSFSLGEKNQSNGNQCIVDRAFFADLHLFLPVFSSPALTDGSVDHPTEVTHVKLIGRTSFFPTRRTFFDVPANYLVLFPASLLMEQKKKLLLGMVGNLPPALLVTAYGLNRYAKQIGNLLLRLFEGLSHLNKSYAIHILPRDTLLHDITAYRRQNSTGKPIQKILQLFFRCRSEIFESNAAALDYHGGIIITMRHVTIINDFKGQLLAQDIIQVEDT